MINAFKTMFKDMKHTWKPALATYVLALIINVLTGIPMDYVMLGIFVTIFAFILLWSIYAYFKTNK